MNIVIESLLTRPVRVQRNKKVGAITNPGGINEQRFERIGGIDQWIGIRGEDRSNPVLLMVHGGPGSPYSIFGPILREWEKHFTVVQWDQRGAGKTLGRNGAKRTKDMTFDRIAHDGIEVTEFVLRQLNKQKVILVGNSSGSIVGLRMAALRPDLFHAYVGTDQNVNMYEAEKMTYPVALEGAKRAGRPKDVAAIEAIGPEPSKWTAKDLTVKEKMIAKTDTVTEDVINTLFISNMLASPIHSLGDVGHIGRGLQFSSAQLFKELMQHDARKIAVSFNMPFFIFQGESDKMTPTALAKEYYDEVKAPYKDFALIKDAGHFAALLKPDQFLELLLTKVLPRVKE